MAIHVRDPETDRIVRALAAREGKTLTETIRDACAARLSPPAAEPDRRPLRERIKPLQDRIAALPRTGLEADKAFYDSLSGDE